MRADFWKWFGFLLIFYFWWLIRWFQIFWFIIQSCSFSSNAFSFPVKDFCYQRLSMNHAVNNLHMWINFQHIGTVTETIFPFDIEGEICFLKNGEGAILKVLCLRNKTLDWKNKLGKTGDHVLGWDKWNKHSKLTCCEG
jgi:hypothetical protein